MLGLNIAINATVKKDQTVSLLLCPDENNALCVSHIECKRACVRVCVCVCVFVRLQGVVCVTLTVCARALYWYSDEFVAF